MSLVFIAFIILFLSITLLSIMRTYNKGIWLNQINSAGRQINSDISDQVRFSANQITVRNDIQRLCVGNVTYIWNTASDLERNDGKMSAKNWFYEERDREGKETRLRFVRVLDNTGKYCNSDDMPNRNDNDTGIMLGPGVVIQKFDASLSPETGLLRVHAVFSTEDDVQPEFNSETDRYQCRVGGQFSASDNQFCAFAEFDIITFRRLNI